MFVTELSIDLWDGITDTGEDVSRPSWPQIESAIRALDGQRRTIVTLSAGGEAHLAVGGGSRNRYIVYMTFDNMHFLNLLSGVEARQAVTMFVGGQDSVFSGNTVVGLELALKAAKNFAETGQPDPACKWS